MGEGLQMLISNFPEGITRAMGMDVSAWTNILSYYSTYYGMHIMILTSVFSITVAGNILAKEERDGTADFLLTRPITREEIVISKVSAFFSLLILLLLIQLVVALSGMFLMGDKINLHHFFTLHIYGFFLTIFFAGLGIFISLFPKRSKAITGTAVGIVLGSFIIHALSRISPDTEWIGYISPFKYADFNVIQFNYGLQLWRLFITGGLGIALFIGAFFIYRRKDIYT